MLRLNIEEECYVILVSISSVSRENIRSGCEFRNVTLKADLVYEYSQKVILNCGQVYIQWVSIVEHNFAWKKVVSVIDGALIASFKFPMNRLFREATSASDSGSKLTLLPHD